MCPGYGVEVHQYAAAINNAPIHNAPIHNAPIHNAPTINEPTTYPTHTHTQLLYEKQCAQLSDIIEIINGELSPNDRKKLITLCTVDVHARDVVQRLIDEKTENANCFQWQSQLRYVYNTKLQDMQVGVECCWGVLFGVHHVHAACTPYTIHTAAHTTSTAPLPPPPGEYM